MSPSSLGLTSPALYRAGFRHGFFQREGGVSPPPWGSLNFFSGSGDAPERVEENFARAGRFLEVEPAQIYVLSQVHGTEHRVLQGDEDRHEVLREQGDITLSAAAGVACGVRTADCVAILIGDRASGAAAAIHSGWRGTVAGAAAAGVSALRQLVDGRGDLVAAVGPHIERCCFEVGDDVATTLAEASGLGEQVVDRSRAKPHVDLRSIVEHQLAGAGVEVHHVHGCTVCDEARFHSYRRDGKVSGRMLAAIVARGEPAPAR